MKRRTYTTYTKELLEKIIPQHKSFTSVLRALGKKPAGGSITNLHLMCDRWEIDTSHMLGSGHNKGQTAHNRKSPKEWLVMGKSTDHRPEAKNLRPALIESGVPYVCNVCRLDPIWNTKPLVLEIDHIDGRYWNNTKKNLQFLCPNCHSQKSTKT